jgi:hypothetical protein
MYFPDVRESVTSDGGEGFKGRALRDKSRESPPAERGAGFPFTRPLPFAFKLE